MKSSTLHISELENILKVDALSPNLDLFHDILDRVFQDTSGEIPNQTKPYFLRLFEQILLKEGSVSQQDAKVFLSLISSKNFKRAYVEVVKNMNYAVDNNIITIQDAEKISRKNNPLFKIFDLQLKLETLLVKSLITHNLNHGKMSTHYQDGVFLRIEDNDYEIIESMRNIFVLFNPQIGYRLFRGMRDPQNQNVTQYEPITPESYENITLIYHSERYEFYQLEKNGKIFLYDPCLFSVILECDRVENFSEIGQDCLIHYKKDAQSYVYSVTSQKNI